MSYKTVLLFIDTCDGISSTFSAIEVGSDIDVSTISYPQPPQHDGFLFCSWDKTVSDVAKIIAAESSKAINFIEVHAEYSKAYVVTFVDDYDGMVISKQNVAYGGNAAVPEYPCHGKYVCICWDKDITSVKSDIEAHPVYVDISSYARKSISHKVINNLRDIAAIQNSLKNIFTWIPGERVLLPEFGSQLRKLLYEGITDYNVERIASEIRRSISEWEPRVQVKDILDVGDMNDTEDNTVHLQVLYTIPGLTDDTFVYDVNYNSGT